MKKQQKRNNMNPKTYLNLPYYLKKYGVGLPDAPLHPGTKKPLVLADLEPLFPRELIRQEMTLEKEVPIPE
jgi:predicted alternative tryptophan synthase beta-subunit